MDFGGDDTAPTAQLTGDEDRIPGPELLAVALGDGGRDFDLAARCFRSLRRVLCVGSGERDQQQGDRLPVAANVLLGVVNQDAAQKQAVENEP